MKHFDEIKNLAIDCVRRNAIMSSTYYIIRDVVGKISVYITGTADTENLKKELSEAISENWVNRVVALSEKDMLFHEVKKNAQKVADDINIFYSERPLVKRTWSDLQFAKKEGNGKIITFYSYKGGVGRTTTLALTALQLVREGKKVVAVDFDLEAPGLSTLLKPESEYPQYGVIDYLIERDNNRESMDINDYIYSINNKKLTGLSGGELLVMQAANLENRNVDDYYNKLSRIDFNMPKYMEEENAIQDLIAQIQCSLDPDYIFIDSRAGIHDIGGIALFRCSDEVVPVFYGNEQNMLGLRFVLPKLITLDIPFYLINSPMPLAEEEADTELNFFLRESFDILDNKGYFTDIPDLYDESSPHFPINIRYDVLNTNLNSVERICQVLNLNGEDNVYKMLSKKLATAVEENDEEHFYEQANKKEILESIEKIMPAQTAAAENEFSNLDSLVKRFYPFKEYRYIFDNSKFLITGAKGSGKTALFNVLKSPEYAHRLAKYVDTKSDSIDRTEWVVGLDSKSDFPTKSNFSQVAKTGKSEVYEAYWKVLAVRVLKKYIKEYTNEYPEYFNDIFDCQYSELRKIIDKRPSINEEIEEYFIKFNKKLVEANKFIIITYDALDSCMARDIRGKFISELISFWTENNTRLSNLKAKIFLRNDIFKNEVTDITDKIKLDNYRTVIEWDYDYLLAMVWKRMLEANGTLKKIIEKALLEKGYSITETSDLGIIPRPIPEINKLIIEELIGNKMGKGNKAYTYNWILYRLRDTNEKIVPRSMLKLFSLAAENEKAEGKYDASKIIKPKSLEGTVLKVSEDRVTDMAEEYPEYKQIFQSLKNYCPVFPVEEEALKEALVKCGLEEKSIRTEIDNLKEIGILKEYQRRKSDPIRYHIPDIYLKGMGLTRKGYH